MTDIANLITGSEDEWLEALRLSTHDQFDENIGEDVREYLADSLTESAKSALAHARRPEDAALAFTDPNRYVPGIPDKRRFYPDDRYGPTTGRPEPDPAEARRYRDRLVDELHAFLCGDPRYEEQRKELQAEGGTKAYLVGVIATAIAPLFGSIAIGVAPAIALMLIAIARVGLNAWCAGKKGLPPLD